MPVVVVIAGPNGAGKSTSAPGLLRDALGITTFVNADEIARGLAGFTPDQAAVPAGRIMLARLHKLADVGADFAFETTLSGRAYVPFLADLRRDQGYVCHLAFFWLPSPEHSIRRVQERVRRGGHHIPEPVIRRRFTAGLRNFFELYRPLADIWTLYNNTGPARPELVAYGGPKSETVADPETWVLVKRMADGPAATD